MTPGDGLPVLAALAVLIPIVAGLGFGFASVLELVYPVLLLVAALALHHRAPGAYIALVLWGWLLTPLLRRVIDQQTSFSPVSPVLLAPYLATSICLVALVGDLRRFREPALRPFVLLAVAVGCGFLIALARSGPLPAAFGLLDWLVPPALAAWAIANPRHYPVLARQFVSVAVVGGVLVSAYGLYQFFFLSSWDALWMNEVALSSIGQPEPLEVRVFSTMNAPGVYAMVAMVLAIVLLGRRSFLKPPAVALLVAGLGLSLVRSAWLGWILGLVFLFAVRTGTSRGRSLALAVLVVPLFVLIVQAGPIGSLLNQRLSSVSNVSTDRSFQDRVSFAFSEAPRILANPLGSGIGSTGAAARASEGGADRQGISDFDNGLLEIPFTLGLLPGALFVLALVRLCRAGLGGLRGDDGLRRVFAAAVVAGLVQMLFVNALKGATGVFIWLALGLTIAGRLHAEQQAPPSPGTAT